MDDTRSVRSELEQLQSQLEQLRRERDLLANRVRELEQQCSTTPGDSSATASSVDEAARFGDAFRVEQSRAKRQRLALSLALIEPDNLQEVRDRLGHAAGEDALVHLAAQLENSLRPTDVVGRVDGLAYGVLLTATNLEQALAAVTRLQNDVAARPYTGAHCETELSFCAGIVQWRNDEGLGDLLSRASRALGLAKKAGTGKVVVG